MDFLAELQLARNAAGLAGRLLAENYHQQKTVIASVGKDIKLELDKMAEDVILNHLSQTGLPILSEEDPDSFERNGSEMYWVVDPLDGSFNYFRKIDACCISIALFHKNEPVLGVINDFIRNKSFYGALNYGAFENDYPIKVSPRVLNESVLATGFPLHFQASSDSIEKFLLITNQFKKVRMLGSAALSLAYVASGKVDSYWERGILFWDVAAGLALARAAGAHYVLDFINSDRYIVDVKCSNNPENLNIL